MAHLPGDGCEASVRPRRATSMTRAQLHLTLWPLDGNKRYAARSPPNQRINRAFTVSAASYCTQWPASGTSTH
jgi:hypothetical protein